MNITTKQSQLSTDDNLVWDFLTDIFFSVRRGYEFLADELVEYAVSAMPNFGGKQRLVFTAR